MKITNIEAKTLPEAWYLAIKDVMENGYDYKIGRGSFAGQNRREFDLAVIRIGYPGSRPLVPDVPPGVPVPCDMEQVEKYYEESK